MLSFTRYKLQTVRRCFVKMELVVKIGDKLKYERIAQTMTQEQLAKKAGISAAALVRIERNQADPHVSTIRKLADALGVEPRTLLEN
jgi:transcriptional regulator with XRE-family HTH domain